MGIDKIDHYSIRTMDLEASRRFYTDVMNFRVGFRPPFDFPGLWLYPDDQQSGFGVVHLIGVDENAKESLIDYLGEREGAGQKGTGSFDHIAFAASDWPAMRARCELHEVSFVERTVPSLGLRQVFLTDPSGLTIELNYPAAEGGR